VCSPVVPRSIMQRSGAIEDVVNTNLPEGKYEQQGSLSRGA